jgi:hypothetical protein
VLVLLVLLLLLVLQGGVLTVRPHHSVKCEALPVSSSWVCPTKVKHTVHSRADLKDLVCVLRMWKCKVSVRDG